LPAIAPTPPSAAQHQANFNALVANVGPHFTVNVNSVAAPNTRWQAAAPNRVLILEASVASPNFKVVLQGAFSDRFAEMMGFASAAAVDAAALKPYVQKVVTTNGDAGTF
jgi:hypothetical protein